MSKQDKKSDKKNNKNSNKKSNHNGYYRYEQPSYLKDFESKWDDCFSFKWGQF
jgi:hypothetical protein